MIMQKVVLCLWIVVFSFAKESLSQATDCERESGRHCHKWAQCERRQEDQRPRCYCSPGFGGDGYNCHRDNQNRPDSRESRCPQPPNIAHGSYSASDGSYRTGTTITYRCQDGYKLEGPSQRTCQQNNQWSGSEPRCDQVECKGRCQRPQNLEGGTMNVGGNCRVGSRVSYRCNQGLMLVGSTERRCKGDGQWTGIHPRCEKATDCERENGKHCHRWAQCERRQEDKKPRCYCSPGYSGDGYNCHQRREDECQKRNYQTCHAHADCVRINEDKYECKCRDDYKGDGIYCESKGCDKPPGVTHGRILSNQQRYVRGNIITYQCNQGYKLMGEAQRTCLDDGRWSGNEPRCEKIQGKKPSPKACQRPQDIQHGTMTASDWTFPQGSTVTYECRKPYQLQGSSQRTCHGNGKWSGSKPRCEGPHQQQQQQPERKKSCQRPQDIQHGTMTANDWNFPPGSTVTYQCSKPYKLQGTSQRTCQDDGKWSGSKPQCQKRKRQGKKCQKPRDIPNGSLRTSDGSYKPRTVVTYECQHPYRLVGNSQRTCLANGKWTGSTPRCEDTQSTAKKKCKRPPDYLPNGRITVSDYQFRPGTVVEYACEKGWRLQGPEKRICQNDGSWTGTFPRCQKQAKDKCENRCHEYAECRTDKGRGRCICRQPHFGDGYYCQGCQGGQVFRECATKCPPTCDNLQPVCDKSCDLNNKCVCPDGKVQRSASDKTCVDRNQCPNYA